MHRLATSAVGWNPQSDGVILIEQTPAPLIFLTAADTDIQTLATAVTQLPREFPALRVMNLLHLQQELTIDRYAETVLTAAQVIVLRLLGGRSYWSYGLEVVKATADSTGSALIILPGDDRPDPDLISHSTISLATVNQIWRYLTEGGIDNYLNALQFIADHCLGTHYNPAFPVAVPRVGLLPHWVRNMRNRDQEQSVCLPRVGVIFYRAHYLSGNTAPIDALCQALMERNLEPVPVFVSSLRDQEVQAELISVFDSVQLILNTTSFAMTSLDSSPQPPFPTLNVPVLQVILSGSSVEQWQTGLNGLTPRDVAMNVALPEVDGRIISRAVSFKAAQTWNESLETDVVVYQPIGDRIDFVADLAANWIKLRQTPPQHRKIALILANYPTRDGRLANGVGLDTPASCIEILKALQQAGYQLDTFPQTGDELIQQLTTGMTNDPEGRELRTIFQQLSLKEYQQYFITLSAKNQAEMGQRWGDLAILPASFPISGLQFGNIFIGIQPARGYDLDPSLNYHAPDLEPTHQYLAFYDWLRTHFQADAIIHVGKHGNLEWLPGKSVALSETCYPEIALGPVPHLYPFIVNDPGEGSQAKRRAQAVIIDHLTPPMTRAELYGALQQLEALIDEYYEAESLDPSRLPFIRDRLLTLLRQENLNQELGISSQSDAEFAEFLTRADGYLCELKEAQIRDGLHIFGQCPQNDQLRDLVISISRSRPIGITRALASDFGLDFDPLTAQLSDQLSETDQKRLLEITPKPCRTLGDAVEALETLSAQVIDALITPTPCPISNVLYPIPHTQTELKWIQEFLLPALRKTDQELTYLLQGLDGQFVPSAPSGAPTRGRFDVLPTGRNFYSVDIRAIPTETAWDIGRKAAEVLIERYTQENGEYPQTLGLSVWGTSTMRTGGDDIAEALALLGVQPVWDGASRRVVDLEILPVSVLGRPRVDVTLRISGFFRDAFPNLIDFFDSAVQAVAQLNEPPEENPLAFRARQEAENWVKLGLDAEQAELRSQYRVFGSKPGAYGAGLQGLIESQNWTDDSDLARAYINWSSYAYSRQNGLKGVAAPEVFEQRLQQLQIVLQNQDNREHDLLDSDDYYQFQGGLTAAVRSITGKNPQVYFGDNAIPQNPKVRHLKEEINRVYRSRVINPKWIAGVMRHGYKGAFEMAATVDYLFAYDATANCVEDYLYQGVAEAYLLDPKVQDFIQEKNPWALRDMAERLLEAHQRGLWENVDERIIDQLRSLVHQAEASIEENLPTVHSF